MKNGKTAQGNSGATAQQQNGSFTKINAFAPLRPYALVP